MARRLDNITALRAQGTNPYPYRFDRTHTLGEIRAAHGALEAGNETTEHVTIAGRIMLKRDQGKLIFAHSAIAPATFSCLYPKQLLATTHLMPSTILT